MFNIQAWVFPRNILSTFQINKAFLKRNCTLTSLVVLLLHLSVIRRVLFFFFGCRKLDYRSWVIPLCILLPEPVSPRLLNSISSKFCHQNTQFNTYTITSKQQEGSTCKDSYPKCFITTNFGKFHRKGAINTVAQKGHDLSLDTLRLFTYVATYVAT